MDSELKQRLSAGTTWVRALYILLFVALYGVAEVVVGAVVLFQFGSTLITGAPNHRLQGFSAALAAYIYQLLQYLCYNSDERPYPFAPWPQVAVPAPPEPMSADDASDAQ